MCLREILDGVEVVNEVHFLELSIRFFDVSLKEMEGIPLKQVVIRYQERDVSTGKHNLLRDVEPWLYLLLSQTAKHLKRVERVFVQSDVGIF